MKYVKLTAKPDTWFKEGTEVFDYDADYSEGKRVTLEHWETCEKGHGICVRGIRVCEGGYENDPPLNCPVGREREDGEYCCCDEFHVEIVEESHRKNPYAL